jgi:hypothetical protein
MRHVIARLALTVFAFASITFLTNCGGGNSGGSIQPLNPQFTSVPPTSASEGVTYTYDFVTTGDGGAGIFALPEAPAGTTFTSTGLTWVPTPEQSRKPNNFTLKLMAVGGGTATQSWTVTPAGTVRVSLIDTMWDENGSRPAPFEPITSIGIQVEVPKADGTTEVLASTGGTDGNYTIPNVPGGYYWLRVSPEAALYWTNASRVDLGADYNAPQTFTTLFPNPVETTFRFDVTGIEPVLGGFLNLRLGPWFSLGTPLGPGTSQTFVVPVGMPMDLTQLTSGRAIEYKPATLGTIKGQVVGPTATLTNLSLTNGGTNVIPVPLTPSPESTLNVNLRGSAWTPLFAKVAPGAATPFSTPFGVSVDPNVPAATARMALAGRSIQLLAPMMVGTDPLWNGLFFAAAENQRADCSAILARNLPPFAAPVVLTDESIQAQYGDPYPSEWKKYVSICQQASVDVPTPDGTSTQKVLLSNGAILAPTVTEIAPLVGPVENPTINDLDLFTKATVNAQTYTLKWNKPGLGTPTGYTVRIMKPFVRNDISGYATVAMLMTGKTSLTIPPTVLHAGQTYLFLITAVVNGGAVMETSPRRTAVPIAHADIISAPITIGAQ